MLKDSLGNCVNMQSEFSCKRWVIVNRENKTTRTGFKEKPGKDGLICKGIPCMDGNCVDKSFETNGKMMDSLSKLYAVSEMNPDKDGNFNLYIQYLRNPDTFPCVWLPWGLLPIS